MPLGKVVKSHLLLLRTEWHLFTEVWLCINKEMNRLIKRQIEMFAWWAGHFVHVRSPPTMVGSFCCHAGQRGSHPRVEVLRWGWGCVSEKGQL